MSTRLSRSASSLMMEQGVRKGETGRDRAGSLRRTLSADMSSREWLTKNGFPPMKKTASSVSIEDSSLSSDDEEDTQRKDVEGCGEKVYIWKSMKESETWSSIMFQKVVDSKSLPPPYVHPMVKRSKSCLSTKSLEVCTESLGSETGADGFSSYPASEVGDVEAEDGHETRATACDNATASRKTRPPSFPPPIQSLSQGNRGGSVSMHSRRDNGRLVLEAISVPTERNFEARREEGRLVLTFANDNESYQDKENEDEDELVMEMDEDICSEEDKEAEETEEKGSEGITRLSGGGLVNIQKLARMLNKYVGAFDCGDEEEDSIQLEQSLPLNSLESRTLSTPQSVPSTAMSPSSLNAYEYFWRNKTPTNTFMASIGQPLSTLKGHGINISVYAKNLASDEGLGNRTQTKREGYPAPLLQTCNSRRRTNLLWETKCIATS